MVDQAVIDRLMPAVEAKQAPGAGKEASRRFISRLGEAIKKANTKLKPFRRQRVALMQRFASANYGESGRKGSPYNTLYLGGTVLVPLLAPERVLCDIRHREQGVTPETAVLAARLDAVNENEIFLAETIREVLFDSLFGPGIVRTGLAMSKEAEFADGELHDVGQVYVDRVSLDDYVVDSEARNRMARMFEGHYYELPKDYVMESGLFSNTEHLPSHDDRARQDTRADAISGERKPYDTSVEKIALLDLYIPPNNPWGGDTGVIITLPADALAEYPLRIAEYIGPEGGPYDMLGYTPFPDNVMPVAPMYIWETLDALINSTARKYKRQADRAKSLLLYDVAAESDAKQIRTAKDGDVIGVMDAKRFQQVDFGGPSDDVANTLHSMIAYQAQLSGNTDLMGGLQTRGGTTATEVATLQGNMMGRIQDMRGCVKAFLRHILKKEAWFVFTAPMTEKLITRRVSGVDLDIQSTFTADMQEADYLDLAIDVSPVMATRLSPEERSQRAMAYWTNVLLPSLPFMQAQGMTIDLRFLRDIAKDMGTDLHPYFVMAEQQAQGQTSVSVHAGTAGGGGQRTRGGTAPAASPGTQAKRPDSSKAKAKPKTAGGK